MSGPFASGGGPGEGAFRRLIPTSARPTGARSDSSDIAGPFAAPARLEAIPSRPLEELLDRLEGVPGAFCLESGLDVAGMGRWHLLGAHPVGEWIGSGTGSGGRWRSALGDRVGSGTCPAGGGLLAAAEEWSRGWRAPREERGEGPPFLGGAVGVFGFELGEEIDPYPGRAALPAEVLGWFAAVPDLHLRLYDELVAIEAASGEAMAITRGRAGGRARRWWEEAPRASRGEPPARGCGGVRELATSLDDAAFLEGVRAVREAIRTGDVYEVNLTRTHLLNGAPGAWSLHRRLRELQPVPYGALLPWEPAAVVCASPERFLRVEGDRVETRPIKGTTARGGDEGEDLARGAALLADEKERAELAMIVDLERNDLGRVCRPGSIRVVEEAALERYATVIHTVATVEGRLCAGTSPFDLLRATFPGGSITGAPKLAALETIARLEPWPRKYYTGALGWIAPDGDLDLAIAIRTVTRSAGRTFFSVGGAVTWDSVPERELAELEAKGRAVFAALRG
jgi:para-aminobenzoate synthetase component 1